MGFRVLAPTLLDKEERFKHIGGRTLRPMARAAALRLSKGSWIGLEIWDSGKLWGSYFVQEHGDCGMEAS